MKAMPKMKRKSGGAAGAARKLSAMPKMPRMPGNRAAADGPIPNSDGPVYTWDADGNVKTRCGQCGEWTLIGELDATGGSGRKSRNRMRTSLSGMAEPMDAARIGGPRQVFGEEKWTAPTHRLGRCRRCMESNGE